MYSIALSASVLSIRILSSREEFGRSYNSRAYSRKLHIALRMYAPIDLDGQVSVASIIITSYFWQPEAAPIDLDGQIGVASIAVITTYFW